jgi:methylase of polypeptide subunit release factors
LNQEIKEHFKNYKQSVNNYKNANDKFLKYELEENINSLKKIIYNFLLSQTEEYKKVDTLLARFRVKSAYEELAKLDDELILWAVKTKTTIDESLFGQNRKERAKLAIEINKAFDEFKNINKKYKNSFEWRFEFPEVLDDEGEFVGFDLVIANPPYISNKDISQKDKELYEEIYGFSDDLYNYFFIKGFEIAKKDGLVAFITSNTFMTINSKINIRKLLQSKQILEFIPIKNPFDEATVEPIIVLTKNQDNSNYQFDYIDLRKEEFDPTKNRYKIDISIYQNTPNKVFFTPTNLNLQIYSKYIPKVKELLNNYWDKISNSINITKNKQLLEEYRKTLKPGDVTLLGLVTNGGQGLATANNGKYIGVKEGTKEANKILQTRKEKIKLFNKRYKKEINIDNLEELEIREIFDSLKAKFGRDIFGQGYIYRIVSQNEIADINSLTQEEKQNGIIGDKTFIPYDKGDRDGNKWYYETPFYIDWSRENVQYLKKDKKARFQGYNFYFKEGFSWSDIHTIEIKSRLKSGGVYDVTSMSLFSVSNLFSDKFFITILNSSLISDYSFSFVNNTPHFQINDARQIPIIVPTPAQLKEFEEIFDKAKKIKIEEFSSKITKEEAKQKLDELQKMVDKAVYKLYDIKV